MVIKFMEIPDLEMLEYRVRNGENLPHETVLQIIQECLHKVPASDFDEVEEQRNYLQDENDKLESKVESLEDERDKIREELEEMRDEMKILERKISELESEEK